MTALAGSVIEALLLWAVQQHEDANRGDLAKSGQALAATKTLRKAPASDPLDWGLHEYTEAAAHLNIISKQADRRRRPSRSRVSET